MAALLLAPPAGRRAAGSAPCLRRCATPPPLKMRRTTTKNTGTKKIASKVAVIIPPITPVPMARWLAEPAPVDTTSGSTPRMKAIEVIRIGRKRRCTASQRRLDQVLALRVQVLGELDDQDRVLRRQADHGDQADLEEDVVRHAAQASRRAPRRARRAAPRAAPRTGSTSSRRAPTGRGRRRAARSRAGSIAVEPESRSSRDWPVHS